MRWVSEAGERIGDWKKLMRWMSEAWKGLLRAVCGRILLYECRVNGWESALFLEGMCYFLVAKKIDECVGSGRRRKSVMRGNVRVGV